MEIENIPIITMTVIITSSITINLSKLFRDMKTNNHVIFKKYKSQLSGNPKKHKSVTEHFKNSIQLVFFYGKCITIRISPNGGIHITGCTDIKQTYSFLFYLSRLIRGKEYIKQHNGIVFFINVVMTNIKFNVNYIIDRCKLDYFLNRNTNFMSLFLASSGCAGVNSKYKITKDELNSNKYIIDVLEYNAPRDEFFSSKISFRKYKLIKGKENHETKHTTVLSFQSGAVLISSINKNFMKTPFIEFKNIVTTFRKHIEEDLM